MNTALNSIHKRLTVYSAGLVACVVLAALFGLAREPAAAAVFGLCAAAVAVVLYRQYRRYYWCKLLCDSKLLTVPSAVVTGPGGERAASETVVSVFGLLLGETPYTWNLGNGASLREVSIDWNSLRISFGAGDALWQAELAHGITDKQEIAEIAKKIKYETGVQATVSDWE